MIIKRFSNLCFHDKLPEEIKINSKITLKKADRHFLGKLLRKLSKSVRKEQDIFTVFDIYVDESQIGDVQIYENSPEELQIPFLWIDRSDNRGFGIGTEVIKGLIPVFKKYGYKTLTLEALKNRVPFYKRLGFKEMNKTGKEKEKGIVDMVLTL